MSIMFLQIAIIWPIIYLANAHESCPVLLQNLSNTQREFVHCVTKNAVPITMCNNCHSSYMDILKSYDGLVTDCSNLYFDKDRINMVAATQTMLTGLWSKAFCDDCFNNNNTGKFGEKNYTFQKCLNISQDDPCKICQPKYMDLNNFYINLDQHNNGEVCYDLQDSINRTRNKWSKELNCCRREQNLTLFAIALCIISVLPVVFYGGTFYLTKYQERNHGILNDDDPIYNSQLPASSRQRSTNNSPQPMIPNDHSSSNPDIYNISTTTNTQPALKNEYDDLESSGEDIQILQSIPKRDKIFLK